MLTVTEAWDRIDQTISTGRSVRVPLAACLGSTLGESITADTDSPPFDKALMDGFAIRAEDVRQIGTELQVLERLTAGEVPSRAVEPGGAIQVMTGTQLPVGADAVVRVEDVADPDAAVIRLEIPGIAAGRNLMRRGEAMRTGEVVLNAGTELSFPQIALLAELGRSEVSIYLAPQVAIVATGNELVPFAEVPGDGQIRNSNEPMLVAQVSACGAIPVPLGIARDDRAELRSKISQGLESDFLLLSGGVSAGVLDLVPSVLAELGVQTVFHQVSVKPGKPIWFGTWSDAGRSCHVFGLPGNPVSSLVCFELFVRRGLVRFQGLPVPSGAGGVEAELLQAHLVKGDRPVYYPGRWNLAGGKVFARPVPWQGSADLRGTCRANGMIHFPPRETPYQVGERVQVYPWNFPGYLTGIGNDSSDEIA